MQYSVSFMPREYHLRRTDGVLGIVDHGLTLILVIRKREMSQEQMQRPVLIHQIMQAAKVTSQPCLMTPINRIRHISMPEHPMIQSLSERT